MRLFFQTFWCFCFIVIAVIGCDQEMKMMKPVVQDVMDPKPEAKPDTTVPVAQPDAEIPDQMDVTDIAMPPSQPVAEVEQDVEMMDPTVPEPAVEAPPVAVAEMPVEPPDMAEEVMEEVDDPYTPLNGLIVFEGRVQFLFFSAGQCIILGGANINGVAYSTHNSKWQKRENAASPWIDIPGTESDEGLCSYSPPGPGQYRLVGEIGINGVRGKYASENILTME